jgi:hypothetical protein
MVKGKIAKALPLAKIGEIAFILVVIVAVVAGLATTRLDAVQRAWVFIALMILGVIVSLTTITEKEVGQFMSVSVTLLIASVSAAVVLNLIIGTGPLAPLTVGPLAVDYARTVLGIVLNIMAFVAPAAIIPSLKAVYKLARKAQ